MAKTRVKTHDNHVKSTFYMKIILAHALIVGKRTCFHSAHNQFQVRRRHQMQ